MPYSHAGIQLLNPLMSDEAGSTYVQKVLTYSPFAYWTISDAAGPAVASEVDSAQNGVATDLVYGQEGIGDGLKCARFDGSSGYCDLFTPALATAFGSCPVGSLTLWIKAFSASTWTVPPPKHFLNLNAGFDFLYIEVAGSGIVSMYWETSGDGPIISKTGISTLDWIMIGLSWSSVIDEIKLYYYEQGVGGQAGSTWTFPVAAWDTLTGLVIGCSYGLTQYWPGYMAHVAMYDSLLQLSDFDSLAVA